MENVIVVNRTPDVIAAEINSIKEQTRIMILCNSIEIGRRLVEAKSMLPHGEWGKWLETSVNYSQSTANNLMRIYEEYGASQFSLFGDHQAKSEAFAKLTYTQAVALLAIPAEEREAFIEENDVEHMSTRELQQAIKERDEALKKLENAQKVADEKCEEARRLLDEKQRVESEVRTTEQLLRKAQEDVRVLQNTLEDTRKQLREARDSGNNEKAQKLQESLEQKAQELDEANRKIDELERKLKEQPIEVATVEKIPEEVQKELETLRKTAGNKIIVEYSVKFDTLVKGFKDLLATLGQLKESSPEFYEQYKSATLNLINKMVEHLG